MPLSRELDREILSRLSQWARGKRQGPLRIVVMPTNRCSLRCLFCGGVYEREAPNKWFPDSKFTWEDEISNERWIRTVEEADELGVVEWLIGGGGEPMVRGKATLGMIETIKRLNPESLIELSTNGTLITKDAARRIVSSGLDYLQTGIDGPTAKVHDFLRGKRGAFRRTLNAIRHIALMKQRLGTDKPVIKVHVVLCSRNYDSLPEMLRVVHSAGANFFAVAAMRIYGGGEEDAVRAARLPMNDEQKERVHEIWQKVEELAGQLGMQLGPAFYKSMEEVSRPREYSIPERFRDKRINRFLSAFCYAPFYGCIVDWAGNVGPCPCAGSVKNIADNSLASRSLKDVWFGSFFTSVRECMLQGRALELENILSDRSLAGLAGLPLHPCVSCGINIERKETSERLARFLKGESFESIMQR